MFINKKGISIIIVLIISAAILGVAVGISNLFIKEIRITFFIDRSVGAIIAADASMERKLMDVRKLGADPDSRYDPITLPNGAQFEACKPGSGCQNEDEEDIGVIRIVTEGEFTGTRRALEAEF